MLSYDEALARILGAAAGPLPFEDAPLDDAHGRALAADVLADGDLPPFDNSAIDGYAVRATDTTGASAERPVRLRVTQTVAAGYAPMRPILPGEAARIFTGAPLPEGTNALVMVEDTEAEGDDAVRVAVAGDAALIRRAGSDLARGAVALRAGQALDAGAIGLLASLNRSIVSCPRRPRVAILTTGDEVAPLGSAPLSPGQIRNSNGPALAAAAREAGAVITLRRHARDTEAEVAAALTACAGCDVIVASGGVSVGDYDFVKTVVQRVGTLDFWRIAIKPGKPLAWGQVAGARFFGLPGNPVSSLVTFELFVRPLLRRLVGFARISRPTVTARLATPLPHAPGRREFARAQLVWREDYGFEATPLGAQGSHRLASLAGADALLIAHEDRGDYAPGDRLPALLLMG